MDQSNIFASDKCSNSVESLETDASPTTKIGGSAVRLQQLEAFVSPSNTTMGESAEAENTEQTIFLDAAPLALSKSAIFPLLEQYYKSGGKVLWEQVPFYVTSNPTVADAYADLIVSFLLDYRPRINSDEPIYILEMGSGSGCFSFYLLKELSRKLKMFSSLHGIKLKYVMCDFSTNTIQGWLDSDYFTPFKEDGLLDFAVFKPEEQKELTTLGGIRISNETVKNPVIAIANYFFDSLCQDAFQVRDHKLHVALHQFYASANLEKLEQEPLTFAALEKLEQYEPVHGNYYDNPILDGILSRYEREMHDATILFPLGPMRCLENLREISNGNLMLLSSDKGFTSIERMAGLWEQPFCSHDGIFSYSVNYDAIRKYFDHFGGLTLATNLNFAPLETLVSVMLNSPDTQVLKLDHTTFSFEERLVRKNITDVYHCQRLLMHPPKEKCDRLKTFISFIRMNNYDPMALANCVQQIHECLSEPHAPLKQPLLAMLKQVEDNFFHVRSGNNVLNGIGRIRCRLGEYSEAISTLNKSLEISQDEPRSVCYALFSLAACYEEMKEFNVAQDYYEQSLKLDPECKETATAIERMKTLLASQPTATSTT